MAQTHRRLDVTLRACRYPHRLRQWKQLPSGLFVSITEEGKLRAVKNYPIFPELRGMAKIGWLATEGSKVKKGDLLVTFNKKELEDQRTTLRGRSR